MRVIRHASASSFLDAAGTFLVRREAEHCLLLGIGGDLRSDETRASGTSASGTPVAAASVAAAPYLATILDDDRVAGAALMTPPHRLILSCLDDGDRQAAVEAVAADLATFPSPPPGVLGPIEVGRTFVDAWCPPRRLTARVVTAERIHRVQRIVPPTGVTGTSRIATAADRDLLVDWVAGFLLEAFGHPDEEGARGLIDRALTFGRRTFHLWEDGGRAVSFAAITGPTPNGARIGPVYTPPERRGRGYASAITARASQSVLDAGKRFVFLLTDVTNPTANKIYRQIGYEPVIEVDDLGFRPT